MNLKLLRQEDGYSYYELPVDLKAKIIESQNLNIKIIPDVWKRGQFITFKSVLPNGKYMYENVDGDVSTVSKEDAEKRAKENIKSKLNKEFNASKFLNENVLPTMAGYSFILSASQDNDVEHDLNRSYETIQFSGGWGYKSIGISVKNHGFIGFFGFNPEGEFYNRDYNVDFNKEIKSGSVKTFDECIDETLNIFDDFVNITKNSKNTFFIESKKGKYALIPCNEKESHGMESFSGFELRPFVRDGVYYNHSKLKTTMTGKEVPATIEDIKNIFLTGVNTFFKEDKEKYQNIICK